MIEVDDLALRIAATKVLCVGDMLMDEIVHGDLCAGAPFPVFTATGSEVKVRGAASVARFVAALGARSSLVSLVGADFGADVIRTAVGPAISLGLVSDPARRTMRATQFRTESASTVMKLEWESGASLDGSLEKRLIARIMGEILDSDIVILVDDEKGTLSRRLVHDSVAAARQQGIPSIVISTSTDFTRYAGATILAPGYSHLCAVSGKVPADLPDFESICYATLEKSSLEALLVLEPGRGLSFVPRASTPTHLYEATSIPSPSRCSDAGVAAFAVALACGFSWNEAMSLCQQAHSVDGEGRLRQAVLAGHMAPELGS